MPESEELDTTVPSRIGEIEAFLDQHSGVGTLKATADADGAVC
jgi:hypothetical protein